MELSDPEYQLGAIASLIDSIRQVMLRTITISADAENLCLDFTRRQLYKLVGSPLFSPALSLAQQLNDAINKPTSLPDVLDSAVALIEGMGGQVIIPEIGDTYDTDIHYNVGISPIPSPTAETTIASLISCGIAYRGHLIREPAVMVSLP